MKRITGAMHAWGVHRLTVEMSCGYSKENIIHRLTEFAVIVNVPSRDRILCADSRECSYAECTKDRPCRYCTDLSINIQIDHAWVQLSPLQKKCVFGKYAMTKYVDEDGLMYTEKQVAKLLKFPWDTFESSWQWGVKRINSKVGL